jgi:hypothetical protein
MELDRSTFQGPRIDDPGALSRIPGELADLLTKVNGYIQFGGGFHVRGICREPGWHSLDEAWSGPAALCDLFPAVRPTDVPFGEDCLGDQYLLRDTCVLRLHGETGDIEEVFPSLAGFLHEVEKDPVTVLRLQPLVEFWNQGGHLEPGQLLFAYPPYCVSASKKGVSLRAISCEERIWFLADLARRLAAVPDGTTVRFVTGP